MQDAWNMTYRELYLLMDVKRRARTIQLGKSSLYDEERVAGLTEHLRSIGVAV